MKPVFLILLSLLITASCGKKVVKKTFPARYADAVYVEDIELFMPELKALFNDQLVTDHFSDDADLLFLVTRIKENESFLGKSFSALDMASSCSTYSIRPNSPTLLKIATRSNTCLNPLTESEVNFPGDYSLDINPFLKEALESDPDRIAVREVTYEGEVYVAFGIQKNSGFNLSNAYKEYLVIPDFPMVLNPVLTYDSQTGEVRALKGIKVTDPNAYETSSTEIVPLHGIATLE